MLSSLLLSVGTLGPVRAFVDSDVMGQFIVIAQILMSICSWAMMLSKRTKLGDIHDQSARFVDTFVRTDDPLQIFIENAHNPAAL